MRGVPDCGRDTWADSVIFRHRNQVTLSIHYQRGSDERIHQGVKGSKTKFFPLAEMREGEMPRYNNFSGSASHRLFFIAIIIIITEIFRVA